MRDKVVRSGEVKVTKKMNRSKKFVAVISWFFIILFVYSALYKLKDYQKFEVELGKSPLMTPIAGFVAWFIPAIEIVISVLLRIRITRLLGLYASFSLMVMFTTFVAVTMVYHSDVVCSCNGILEGMGWIEHLIFNITCVLLAAWAVILQAKIIEDSDPEEYRWKWPPFITNLIKKKQLLFNP